MCIRDSRVDNASEIDPSWLDGVDVVGVTSGASVPDSLVRGVLTYLESQGFPAAVEERLTEENLTFALPPELRKDLRAAGVPDPS
jgi:4-hydroxy-3-methylbut-2-enyl diphosphate reductase